VDTQAKRERTPIVSWRERAQAVLFALRDHAKRTRGPEIEAWLHERFGDAVATTDVADLELAFDAFVCTPGSAGEEAGNRSIVRAFAEDAPDLEDEERQQLPTWEGACTRRVHLLDRCHRDRLDLWDPVAGDRLTLHLLEKMAKGRVAELARGTVVIATSLPWGTRLLALGRVEIYDEGEAVALYRREVRESGRHWHDLPAPTPA